MNKVGSVVGAGDGVADGLADGLDGERHVDVAHGVALPVDCAQRDAPQAGVHPVQLRDVTRRLQSDTP